MKIKISNEAFSDLRRALRRGGSTEIGGILMGEYLGDDTFRLMEISVQETGGTISSFVRDPERSRVALEQFFERTGKDYSRFNYIGEWHSHPLFHPTPSFQDVRTMQSIVEDPTVGAHQTVLLIARRLGWQVLISVTGFRPGGRPFVVDVELEPGLVGKAIKDFVEWFPKRGLNKPRFDQ